MARPPVAVPKSGAYWLADAHIPAFLAGDIGIGQPADALVPVDMMIDGAGRLTEVQPAGPKVGTVVSLAGALVLPGFLDVHTHLDKGFIWPRRSNPNGTFDGALNAVKTDREANWTAEDVRARMEFGLRCAYSYGTVAIRTHIDSLPPQQHISWPVFAEIQADWADRIALEATPLFTIDRALDAPFLAEIEAITRPYGGPLGVVTPMVPELDDGLDAFFRLAADTGRDVDIHVDETQDPTANSLIRIAETAKRIGYQGRILCGHCCSLARQDDDTVDRTLDLMAETGISVVSLPMCNMYLQDRHAGRTPRWRGVTLLHEMKARGIRVMVASDNTRDPFYAYGDLDLWEVFRSAVRTVHLDHPISDWIDTVLGTPASIMRAGGRGRFTVGTPADLIIFRGRSWNEALARTETDRVVLRSGRAIDRTLPDYDELDALFASKTMEAINA